MVRPTAPEKFERGGLPKRCVTHRRVSLEMNFPMSIAAVGAWAIGEQAEAAARSSCLPSRAARVVLHAAGA